MSTQRTFLLAFFIAVMSIPGSTTEGQPFAAVSPAGTADEDGNGLFFPGSAYPNSPFPLPQFSGRAHELHPAAAFDSLGAGPFTLTSLAWRPDISVNEPISSEWGFTIRLSTTDVGALSTTFADNIGPDGLTEVFSGAVQLVTDGVPRGNGLPHEFDYRLDFHTPFVFDPQQGDLLVEMIFMAGENSDWFWVDGDDRVGEFIFAQPADAVEDDAVTPGVFVTQFEFIPEPSTAALAGLGVIGILTWRQRKASKT